MIKTISERLVIEMFVLNDVSWPYTTEKRKVSFLQMLKYMISMTIKLCVFKIKISINTSFVPSSNNNFTVFCHWIYDIH